MSAAMHLMGCCCTTGPTRQVCAQLNFACGYAIGKTFTVRFRGPDGQDETYTLTVNVFGNITKCFEGTVTNGDWIIDVTPPEPDDIAGQPTKPRPFYGPPQSQTVTVADDSVTARFLFRAPVFACVQVWSCWGAGTYPAVGAGVAWNVPDFSSSGSAITDSTGKACAWLPGVILTPASLGSPDYDAYPMDVAIVSPYDGLQGHTIHTTVESVHYCTTRQNNWVLIPQSGYVCCCPYGTPQNIDYSDDLGSCVCVAERHDLGGGAVWVGYYSYSGCRAKTVVCNPYDPYGFFIRQSQRDDGPVQVRITIRCLAHTDSADGKPKLRFSVLREVGAANSITCIPLSPIDCPGYPGRELIIDSEHTSGGFTMYQSGATDPADDVICDPGYTFSMDGTFSGMSRSWDTHLPGGAPPVYNDAQQAPQAHSFTISA